MKFAKAKDSAANENAIDPKEQAGGEEDDDDDDSDEAAAVKPKKSHKEWNLPPARHTYQNPVPNDVLDSTSVIACIVNCVVHARLNDFIC